MARSRGPVDLPVAVDRQADTPLRDQITDQVRAAIRERRLRPGVRLPATRRLAIDLGISRGVVVEAYGELLVQGYLVAEGRASPRVASMRSGIADAAAQAEERPPRSYRFDMAPEVPDMGMFPRREWLRSLRFALETAPDQSLDYGDPRGAPELRAALADYLGRTRGVVTDPDCVVVCQGSIQAIDLACRALAAHGALRMAVEDPCAHGIRYSCRYAGLEAISTTVEDETARVEEIIAAAPDAAIVSPVHQFPTGAVLPAAGRRRLLRWLESAAGALIEDDYDAEYCYTGNVAPALQGSARDRVIYVGSASKALTPAIRLGWAVFPARLAKTAGELKEALDGGSPAVEQIALAHMIGHSVYERHVRRVRVEYRRRRHAMLDALAHRLPGARVSGADAGLHFAMRLSASVDRAAVERRANARRIRLRAMESFMAQRPTLASTLLIGYGRLPAAAAGAAVEALADVLQAA